MTNPSNEHVCPICGGSVEVRREGSTQGLFCTKCDWSVVTTILPDYLQDTTIYEVRVTSGDFKNDRHLKSVGELAGVNLLAARKLLQEPAGFVIFSGVASEVIPVRDTLRSVGLEFSIQPPFSW